MDKNKKVMGLFLLLGIFLLFCFSALKQSHTVYISIRSGDGEVPVITAQLTSGETSISIDAWCSDTGEYYLFLPSWAEGRLIQTEGSGLQTVSGEGSKSFSLPILSSGQSFRLEGGQTLTILTGSQIPSVYLTLKHDLSHISSDQEQSDSGQALILSGDGETVYAGGLEKIKGRGNTSWEQEKKPYNITLQDSVTLPGMTGQTTDYSLVSSSDLTFLRNRISNEMGELAGTGSMACIRVNLYINNSFEGVYELYQRITPENMNLTNLEELTEQANPLQSEESLSQLTTGLTIDDWNQSITGKWWDYENNPENIAGGYILEADNAMRYSGEASGFILESGAYMVAKSPAYLSEAQYQYISSYVQECEDVMRKSVGLNDYQALSAYIDIPSFVGKYLVEEVSKNIDSSATSQYFYKDRDGLLYAGPVWDYDWAYGVERIQEEIDYTDPEGFSARDIPGSLIWWQLLYYNNAFYEDVVTMYENVLYPWLNELVEAGLNQWAQELSASAFMDYLRWDRAASETDTAASDDTSAYDDAASSPVQKAYQAYQEQVEQVRSFLSVRKEFLYREWVG